jgi:hypothetical protein
MPIIMLAIGTIVGAAVMYILDPIAGRRRRTMTRDQMLSKVHDMSDVIESKARHYRNKARGVTAELRSKVDHKEEIPVPAGPIDTTSNIGM